MCLYTHYQLCLYITPESICSLCVCMCVWFKALEMEYVGKWEEICCSPQALFTCSDVASWLPRKRTAFWGRQLSGQSFCERVLGVWTCLCVSVFDVQLRMQLCCSFLKEWGSVTAKGNGQTLSLRWFCFAGGGCWYEKLLASASLLWNSLALKHNEWHSRCFLRGCYQPLFKQGARSCDKQWAIIFAICYLEAAVH